MRVLVTVNECPAQKYPVKLTTCELARDVIELIKSCRHQEAIMLTLAGGIVEKEITDSECYCIKADLMLSKTNARWYLV